MKRLLFLLQVFGVSYLFSYDPVCREKLVLSPNSPEAAMDILLDLERDRARLIHKLKKNYDTKAVTRPFGEREEIRYFLQKQYGNNWLEGGTALLKALSLGSKTKESLSAGERLLADGTLLFLRFDWAFENANVLDDRSRVNRIEDELRLGILEVEIDERRKATRYAPLDDRIYSDERIEVLDRERDQAEESIVASGVRLKEISDFLYPLEKANAYLAKDIQLGNHIFNIEEYWRSLGYSEIPY